ncbi:preprotein translocase subunit SecY [Candidatus Micrarchaeota archaeon RBG_16_49_10]|nr:MAG: preprotein translocase subunit SecY [Candidatus Micrarchaeota archaeon RBG_16_49_10]
MVDVSQVARFLPEIRKPTYKFSLNKKLLWTGIVLAIYFMFSSQLFGSVYGVSSNITQQFQTLQMLFGSNFGTLMTLGIGPLVTSSILLQLLVGSKIINWDVKDPDSDDKKKYEVTQKVLSIAFCFVEAVAFVLGGAVPASAASLVPIVIMQLALGGLIVMMLDEITTKYGIGSGISLFIAAGVVNTIFISLFSPCAGGVSQGCVWPSVNVEPVGKVWASMIYIVSGAWSKLLQPLLPIFTTLVVFFIIVYAQGISVDIPISFAQVRGFGRRWGLKLFYTSNIPVILAAALISQFSLVASFTSQASPTDPNLKCGFLGCISTESGQNVPVSGIVYYLSPPSALLMDTITGVTTSKDYLAAFTYGTFMLTACVLFSVFWVNTSGMDSESVAEQLSSVGMQIPGYRRDPRIMKKVLDRYIMPLAVMGGLSIGFLSILADFVGAIGTGTGILLTTTIIYTFYEQLKNERLDGAHPLVRGILEG